MSQNPSSSNSERDTDQVNQTTDAQTKETASEPVSLIEHTEKVELKQHL
jgi:HlyD family secretion protein